jgi:hypothetical protein
MFTTFNGFGLPTLGLWTSGIRGALGSLAESDTMNDHEAVRQTNRQGAATSSAYCLVLEVDR